MERVEELLGELLALAQARAAGVDRARSLIAGPGELDLHVRVAGFQPGLQPGVLLDVQVLHAVPEQPADLVQRVVLVPAALQRPLLNTAADLVDYLGAEVRSARGAVSVSRPVRLPGPPPEPDVRVATHPALHEPAVSYALTVVVWTHGEGMCSRR